MARAKQCTAFDFTLFLFISILLFGALPIVYRGPYLHLRAIPIFGAAFTFYIKRSPLAGPSLFLLFLSASLLISILPSLWLFNLFVSIAVYLMRPSSGSPASPEQAPPAFFSG